VLELLLNSFSYKLAPQLTIWRRLNPNRNGALPTGMRVLASNCGDTYVDLIIAIRSELGFDVNVVHSLQIQLGTRMRFTINILHDHGVRKCVTPVDPAGPHCYRDRTKTC
jgi:hypothetical protein